MEAISEVSPPNARRAFAAGALEDGWQVMQLWARREDLELFNREVFFPSVNGLGGRGFPEAPVVHDVETVAAWIGNQQI